MKPLIHLLWAGLTFVGSALTHVVRDGPVKLATKFVRAATVDETLLTSIAGHWRVVRLMSRNHTRVLIRHYPQLLYRYVGENLAKSFPKRWRREILINHYQYLIEHVREDFFEVLLRSGCEIWRGSGKHSLFAIKLYFTGRQNFDGDLLLTFTEADKHLYQLAFTIVPGRVLGCGLANVMLISRIQGARGEFEAIRQATKSCRQIALPYQLMASAHGIAEALDITMIAGLRIEEFPYEADAELNIKFDYDAFWRSFVSEARGGFYFISVPLIEKPLVQIDRAHRRRALSKRKFKAAITETACRRFRNDFRKPAARAEANSNSTNMLQIRTR